MFDYFMFKLGAKIGPWPFWTYIWEAKSMVDHFMFKLGAKIGRWPFWTYIWEGGGNYTDFPPSIDVSTDVSTHASTDVSTHASTDASTDVGVYAFLLKFSGKF